MSVSCSTLHFKRDRQICLGEDVCESVYVCMCVCETEGELRSSLWQKHADPGNWLDRMDDSMPGQT